jgi:hypothetical protein
MTDPGLDPIFDHLRERSGRYSFTALREQLIETGYGPAEVDRAIAIYQHENPPKPPVPFWPKALKVAAANFLVAMGGYLAVRQVNGSLTIASLMIGAELPVGIVLASWRRSRVWGRALLVGFLLFLAPVLLLGGAFVLFILTLYSLA